MTDFMDPKDLSYYLGGPRLPSEPMAPEELAELRQLCQHDTGHGFATGAPPAIGMAKPFCLRLLDELERVKAERGAATTELAHVRETADYLEKRYLAVTAERDEARKERETHEIRCRELKITLRQLMEDLAVARDERDQARKEREELRSLFVTMEPKETP